jgi:hypothetical protein
MIYTTSVTLVSNDLHELVEKRKRIAGGGQSNWGDKEDDEDVDMLNSGGREVVLEGDTEMEGDTSVETVTNLSIFLLLC